MMKNTLSKTLKLIMVTQTQIVVDDWFFVERSLEAES